MINNGGGDCNRIDGSESYTKATRGASAAGAELMPRPSPNGSLVLHLKSKPSAHWQAPVKHPKPSPLFSICRSRECPKFFTPRNQTCSRRNDPHAAIKPPSLGFRIVIAIWNVVAIHEKVLHWPPQTERPTPRTQRNAAVVWTSRAGRGNQKVRT